MCDTNHPGWQFKRIPKISALILQTLPELKAKQELYFPPLLEKSPDLSKGLKGWVAFREP